MPAKKIKLYILVLLLMAMPLSGFGCKFSQSNEVQQLNKPVNLSWWGVWEESAQVASLINAYQSVHPNINITYRKFRWEEYEAALTRAWLEQRGPDIYSIPASYLHQYQSLIQPMPATMRLPFVEMQGAIKKEPVTVIKTVAGLTPSKLKDLFVGAIADEAVIADQIYGLPLSLDSLALYYNRDILNNARIPLPATTWSELVEQVSQLAVFDQNNNINQAAIALGTSDNIPRSSDILSLLMMQNGATMSDDDGRVIFNQPPEGVNFYPAKDALDFYTSFANTSKAVYTWNEDMPDALEAFTSGRLAYFIGYSYQLPIIRAAAPKLNFNVAPMLQTMPDVQEINFADWWALTTYFGADETKIAPAWNFIKFITTTPEVLGPYLTEAKRPTALRALINDQIQQDGISVFANQVLTAQNWYRGYDAVAADQAMQHMIDQANHDITDKFTLNNLLDLTADKINQTNQPPQP